MKSPCVKPILLPLFVLGGVVVAVALAAAAAHVLDWRVNGSGDVNGTCTTGLVAGCTLTSTGNALGTHVGNSTYTFAVTTGATSTANASGGLCFPANNAAGQSPTVIAVNGATINFNTVGWLCEEGATGSPLHYNGTYRIVPGTGRFSNAVGGGNLAATFETDADPVAFIKLDGVINF